MSSTTRWQFNPFDHVQPLRKSEFSKQSGLPRSQSLTELQYQNPPRPSV